ncbi:hypothetical protein M0802_006300 [Mischocyttarus mexicanus]|nr:hypothetical protein M0802_006300 [Mischocyttarus mexicanus]
MGNIPVPFSDLPGNIRTNIIERRLFICKMFSLSACIVGTAAYIRPIDSHIGVEYFGIVVPGLITGYIIINSSEILAMYIEEPHTFLEVCFAVIGFIGSILSCFFQFFMGIDWSKIFTNNSETILRQENNTRKLIVALACLINSIALFLVVIIRWLGKYQSRISTN